MKNLNFCLTLSKKWHPTIFREFFTHASLSLLLIFFSSQVQGQIQCCSKLCDNNIDNVIWICEELPDSYGPFQVKIYLYFVVPSNAPNAFSDPLEVRSATIWENWRAAYSPHRIFFVSGFEGCDDSEKFDVISSDLSPSMASVESLRALGYKHTDGIDVYIFRDDVGNDGNSFCTPSTYFFLCGTETINIPGGTISAAYSKTQIVSHELAHCLGLSHTYEKGEGANECEDDGTDCQHFGDMVCDTPPDPGGYVIDGNCNPSVLTKNIMSGFKPVTCLTDFTLGQGRRMRMYLKQEIGDLEQVRIQDIVITGQVTWNTPMNPGANVIIEPGARLTINTLVTMQEGAHIFVRSADAGNPVLGGYLTINGTITAACDKMWGGIVVEGYDSQVQTSQYQGRVFASIGSIIEHARCGIRVQGLNNETGEPLNYGGGGIVNCLWARFRNNTVGVQFGDYKKEVNKGYFSHTQFITNNDYRGEEPPVHLKLKGVRGVRFQTCRFADDRTESFSAPPTRATGIEADNGGFQVYGTSHFIGLHEGIRFYTTDPLIGTSIVGADFDACFTGIYSNDNNLYVISGNTFAFRRLSNYTGPSDQVFNGIYLEGNATAFTVSDNSFSPAIGEDEAVSLGIDVLALGTSNKSIVKNTYYNLNTGNRAKGINAAPSSGGMIFNGLWYECNDFSLSLEHDNIVQNGSIRLEQGRKNIDNAPISSGNEYLDIIGQQFTNNGAGIFYHHIINTSQELIEYTDTATIKLVQGAPNTACGDEECPPPCDTETELASTKTQFFQEKQVWATKTAAFPSITDISERQNEANTINRLRLSLDRAGGRIILHYALDTTGLKTDSILTWLGHLDNYDADLQLARHYFFTGNYTAANNLLQSIPTLYDLSGDLLAEFNDTKAILQAIRPRLQTGVALGALPETLTDSIATLWGADCSAAGALARNILYRNGMRMEADCEEILPRASQKIQKKTNLTGNQSLKIFPNPANDELVIELPKTVACTGVEFIGLADGRSYLHVPTDKSVLKINTAFLLSGVYAVIARLADGSTLRAKLLIAH